MGRKTRFHGSSGFVKHVALLLYKLLDILLDGLAGVLLLVLFEVSGVDCIRARVAFCSFEGRLGLFGARGLLAFLRWLHLREAARGGRALFLVLLPLLVVASQVAVLAQAFRVVQLVSVVAVPGLLRPASSVVASDAHVFGIVLFCFVRAIDYFSLLFILLKWSFFGIADRVSLIRALTRLWVRKGWGVRFGIAVHSLRRSLLLDENFQKRRYLIFLLPLFPFVLDVVVEEKHIDVRGRLEGLSLEGLGFE